MNISPKRQNSLNVKKKTKKKEDTDEATDIIELYYKDRQENKDPAQRRLKWVKKGVGDAGDKSKQKEQNKPTKQIIQKIQY